MLAAARPEDGEVHVLVAPMLKGNRELIAGLHTHFRALFDPKGVLVAGVSTHPAKFGFVSLHNILAPGYQGAIYGVSREPGDRSSPATRRS